MDVKDLVPKTFRKIENPGPKAEFDPRLFDFLKEDPASDPEARARLQFEPLLPRFEEVERACRVGDWQPFGGIVLTVVITDGKTSIAQGSAVLVGKGIAICATHVIQGHLEALMQSRLTCILGTRVDDSARAWRITSFHPAEGYDVCILSLQLASPIPADGKIYYAAMTTRLPAVGETLSVTGYRPHLNEFVSEEQGVASIFAALIVSMGKVTDQHPVRQDSVLAPWPCLAIDCPAWGAMSGGPVFDAQGFLVGVVARSWETGGEPSPMTCALLFPAFGIHVNGGWPERKENTSLLGFNGTHCVIERPEAIQIFVNEAGTEAELRHYRWTERT